MNTSDNESDSMNSDMEATKYAKKLKKHKKKQNKSKKKKDKKSKKSKKSRKETSDSESNKSEYEEKTIDNTEGAVQRDDWMQNAFEFNTFSKVKETKEKVVPDTYDPRQSSRELNPHWKTNGTGLPAFKKPINDDEDEDYIYKKRVPAQSRGSGGWRKQVAVAAISIDKIDETVQEKVSDDPARQLNELSAKKIKAEIMGNAELAEKLEKEIVVLKEVCANEKTKKKEEHILLTRTDALGNCRPLASQSNESYSRKRSDPKKNKRPRVETHKDGERVRYFLDDDKYDIKQMFEREKGISAADANLQFANMTKHPKEMDDEPEALGTSTSGRGEVNQAIKSQEKLDNCEQCFDSVKCVKHLVVEYHKHFYISMPWYIGLQSGQCLLTPIQHCIASTYLDEDSWDELKSFQRSLVKLFAAQNKDVLFFETARNLKWKNHMRIHCVPIPKSNGEMAPFYFKKAIEESEQEWSVNKQLVSLSKKDLRRCIPKGLPYFWINFGLDSGFAHVIEDEARFPNNFAEVC